MNTIRLFLFTVLLFTMSAFALGESLLRSAARRRLNGDIKLTLTVPGDASAVRMTGPWWGWDPNGGPEATDNGDGTWTVTLDPTENMEYLWVVDGVQENLIDNAANTECTAKIDGGSLITDYSGWANRVWVLDSGDVADIYDSCVIQGCTDQDAYNYDSAATVDDGSCIIPVYGCTEPSANNYDSAATVDDGSCTYRTCADIYADNSNTAFDCSNDANDIAANPGSVTCNTDGCTASECCTVVPSTLTITTTVCETASDVRIVGPWWNGWDPASGPLAEDNGDGTWTFTFNPAPTDDMEYKLLVGGEQENLIGKGVCAPITDDSSYANRQWTVGSGNVVNTYGTCGNCDDLVDEPDPPAPDPPARIPRPELDDKWHLQIECIDGLQNCWANGEKQHYTDRLENAYVSGGHLHIVAKKEEYVSQGVTRSYTSARLNSKYDFKYGTVKVRAKLPKKSGLWPAIWTLGSDISEVGVHDFGRSPEAWPSCGEIDIMEQYGTQDFVGSAMHGPSYDVITAAAGGNAIPWNTAELSPSVDEFHVYSLDWREDQIRFLVDGVPHKTVTAPSDKANWPFDHEHFLLLNVAVEPGRTGGIDPIFVSGEMVVDYVRIYGENGDLNWSDDFGGVSVSDCPGLKEAFQVNCDCGVEYTSSGSLASVVSASDCYGLKKAYKENCNCEQ